MGREEEQVKVSILRMEVAHAEEAHRRTGKTFIKAWGEVEVRRTRKRPIGARGRHFSRPEGG